MRDDVVRQKAAELAEAARRRIAAELKTAKDFAATAKKHNLEVKPTELLPADRPIPDIGMTEEVDAAAFSLRSTASAIRSRRLSAPPSSASSSGRT